MRVEQKNFLPAGACRGIIPELSRCSVPCRRARDAVTHNLCPCPSPVPAVLGSGGCLCARLSVTVSHTAPAAAVRGEGSLLLLGLGFVQPRAQRECGDSLKFSLVVD